MSEVPGVMPGVLKLPALPSVAPRSQTVFDVPSLAALGMGDRLVSLTQLRASLSVVKAPAVGLLIDRAEVFTPSAKAKAKPVTWKLPASGTAFAAKLTWTVEPLATVRSMTP